MLRFGPALQVDFHKHLALACALFVLVLMPVNLPAASSVVDLSVPDLKLTDQNGQSGKFLSDFIGDRLAAITFTYTTCTTICPVLDGIFKSVQNRLGDELGKNVSLITISIDPATDIPQRLKEHADKFGAKPGWSFLTGDRETVNRVLKGMEVYSPDIFNHPPTVFIVDGRRGTWLRMNGFPSPGLVEKALRNQQVARNDS